LLLWLHALVPWSRGQCWILNSWPYSTSMKCKLLQWICFQITLPSGYRKKAFLLVRRSIHHIYLLTSHLVVHNETIPAIAYIAGTELPASHFTVFDTFHDPTEQHLVACHVHLIEYWEIDELPVHRYRNHNDFEKVSVWNHPGFRSLSLAKIFVEVNARRNMAWTMVSLQFYSSWSD